MLLLALLLSAGCGSSRELETSIPPDNSLAPAYSQFPSLREGCKVWVELGDGAKLYGTLLSCTEDTLYVDLHSLGNRGGQGEGLRRIPLDSVVELKVGAEFAGDSVFLLGLGVVALVLIFSLVGVFSGGFSGWDSS